MRGESVMKSGISPMDHVAGADNNSATGGSNSVTRGSVQIPGDPPVVELRVSCGTRSTETSAWGWMGAAGGSRGGLPAIALSAIGGNRIGMDLRLEARIPAADSCGVEAGIGLGAAPVECEQRERNHEENAHIQPACRDKHSHEFEQFVHFTFPSLRALVHNGGGIRSMERSSARSRACRGRSRANSVPVMRAPRQRIGRGVRAGVAKRGREVAWP
jgi:hypothetical protein